MSGRLDNKKRKRGKRKYLGIEKEWLWSDRGIETDGRPAGIASAFLGLRCLWGGLGQTGSRWVWQDRKIIIFIVFKGVQRSAGEARFVNPHF